MNAPARLSARRRKFFIVFFKTLCYNNVMESVRTNAYAKINLTLYITGVKDGYHMLDSIVTSVDLCDRITVRRRMDRSVKVTMRGMGCECIPEEENNAYLAAKLFVEEFNTSGADINIVKKIPVGAGLGGSSADAAGVLNALSELYKVNDIATLKLIADRTGSDTRYMLTGGWARLFGRGDVVQPIKSKLKLNILLLVPDGGVSTKQCFAAFDKSGVRGGNSDSAELAVTDCDARALSGRLSNSLMDAAASLSGEIKSCIDELKAFDPLAVNMTGSGNGVYALFENREFCEYAKSRYAGCAKAYILKTR